MHNNSGKKPNKPRNEFVRELVQHFIVACLIAAIGTLGTILIKNETLKVIIAAFAVFALLVLYALGPLRASPARWLRTLRMGTRFQTRSSIHHELIHKSRDLEVMLLPRFRLFAPLKPSTDDASSHAMHLAALERHRGEIIAMLEHVVRLFEQLVPNHSKVWGSLRVLKEDRHYHTFARAGRFNHARAGTSKPLPKSAKTVQHLRQNLDSGRCVIITGPSSGPECWTEQPNDDLGEDKCVLMGAVCVRSSTGKPIRQLAWMLGVCADQDDAFDERHVSLMQSCTDSFSSVLNVLVRTTYWQHVGANETQVPPKGDDEDFEI